MKTTRQPNLQKTGIAALIGAALAASVPGLALAQDKTAIEEVIVTAQKREERLQDVPIAISAITKAQIEERGIDDILDLKALAPNLMISKYPNSNVVSQVAIRGGVTVNAAMYWEPSTGMYPSASPWDRCSTSSTWSVSRCCAGRRARFTVATPWPARST